MTPEQEVQALKQLYPEADAIRPAPITLRQYLEQREEPEAWIDASIYYAEIDKREAIITRKAQMVELLWVGVVSGWGAAIFLAVMWGMKR